MKKIKLSDLTMDDNGFTWNSSDIKERDDFCKRAVVGDGFYVSY